MLFSLEIGSVSYSYSYPISTRGRSEEVIRMSRLKDTTKNHILLLREVFLPGLVGGPLRFLVNVVFVNLSSSPSPSPDSSSSDSSSDSSAVPSSYPGMSGISV
jgi:hypothetical protein